MDPRRNRRALPSSGGGFPVQRKGCICPPIGRLLRAFTGMPLGVPLRVSVWTDLSDFSAGVSFVVKPRRFL